MKKFSDELAEDRDFELGGEAFRWRYPHWEETAAIFDADVQMLRELEAEDRELIAQAQATAQSGAEPSETLRPSAESKLPTTKEATKQLFDRILIFIDDVDDGHKRFRALTRRRENPIPLFQYTAVYQWLLRVTSNRPTTPPSASEPGGGSTEATSQGGSSSTAATPTA